MRPPLQHTVLHTTAPGSRRSARSARRTAPVVGAVLAILLAVSGCADSQSGGAADQAPAGRDLGMTEQSDSSAESGVDGSGSAGSSAMEPGMSQDSAAAPADDPAFSVDRQVISTGYATVTADDPLDASDEAVEIVGAAGGRVDGRSEQAPTDGNKGSVTLTLRIPADTFDATLDELTDLGRDVSVETQANDVTTQTQDLDARITALSASVDRLLALLATAQDTAVLVELETAISDRQGELDSLQSQRRYLADQVSMSTLTLTLVSEADVPGETPQTFWDALVAGVAALGAFLSGAFLALGYALPWLAVVALGVLVVLLIARRRRASKDAAAQKAAAEKAIEKAGVK
jgi:hypothetical protein